MRVTFYIGPSNSIGAGIDDGHVITPSGAIARLTPDWQRTTSFGEDDLTVEAAIALVARLRTHQDRLDELQRTRDLIGMIKVIRQTTLLKVNDARQKDCPGNFPG